MNAFALLTLFVSAKSTFASNAAWTVKIVVMPEIKAAAAKSVNQFQRLLFRKLSEPLQNPLNRVTLAFDWGSVFQPHVAFN